MRKVNMTAAWENEELLVALREAVRARLAVPDEFVQAGQGRLRLAQH